MATARGNPAGFAMPMRASPVGIGVTAFSVVCLREAAANVITGVADRIGLENAVGNCRKALAGAELGQ